MQEVKLEDVLKNLAFALGVGWKADLINLESGKYYHDSFMYKGFVFKQEADYKKELRVELNKTTNKIKVTSIYRPSPSKRVGYTQFSYFKTYNISLKRKYTTIAKLINTHVLAGYEEKLLENKKSIDKERSKLEERKTVLECIKKVTALDSIWNGGYHVKGTRADIYPCTNNKLFELKIQDVPVDKLIQIITILKKESLEA